MSHRLRSMLHRPTMITTAATSCLIHSPLPARCRPASSPSIPLLASWSSSSTPCGPQKPHLVQNFGSVLSTSLGSRRSYSEEVGSFPVVADPGLQKAFKDLMAAGWSDLPAPLVKEVKSALSKTTDDTAGKEVVEKVFRAAVAVEEFGAIVMNLKMELDDAVGASGENTENLADVRANAIRTIFSRYTTYLESFGPDEVFLLKKVESELGGKMIFLKMRCKGLGAEWAKVSVIATSGLAGSYVEQRS